MLIFYLIIFFLSFISIWNGIIAFHFSYVNNYRKDNLYKSVVRFAIDNKKSNPIVNENKNNSSTYRKSKYTPSMIKYEEELIKPWQLSDSVNSTTLRLLFNLQEEITNFWFKLEQQWSSWSIMITSKVERDIRVTLGASDYVTRKVTKDTEKLFIGAQELQNPLRSLPSRIKAITSKSETLSLIMRGVDTTEGSKLLGGFSSQSTKERSVQLKKQKQKLSLPTGGVDSVYRSIRTLPNKLQYDYQRRVVKQKLSMGDGSTNDDDKMMKARLMLPSAAAAIVVDLETNKLSSFSNQLGTLNYNSEVDDERMENSFPVMTLTKAVAYIVKLAISNKFEKLSIVLKKVQKVVFDRQLDKWLLEKQNIIQNVTDDIAKDIFSISSAITAVMNLNNVKVQYYNSSNSTINNIDRIESNLILDKRNIESVLIGMRGVSYLRDRLLLNAVAIENNRDSTYHSDYLLLRDVADGITSILNEEKQLLQTIYRTLETISPNLENNAINKFSSMKEQNQRSSKSSTTATNVIETSMLIIDSISSSEASLYDAPTANINSSSSSSDTDVVYSTKLINDIPEPISSERSSSTSTSFEETPFKQTDKSFHFVKNEQSLIENDFDTIEDSVLEQQQQYSYNTNIDKEHYISLKFADIEKDVNLENDKIPFVSSVVETSAETSDTSEVRVIKFVITTVDVVFFLIETLFKAIGPILKGGGKKALQRIVDTLFIPETLLLFTNAYRYFPIISSSSRSSSKKLALKGPILMDVPMNETIRISLLDTSINWRIYNQFNTIKLSKVN